MKPNVLFLVHVEDTFRYLFPPLFEQRLIRARRAKKYDRIICLVSQVECDKPIDELQFFDPDASSYMEQWNWGWGYSNDNFDTNEQQWLIDTSSPHNTTWISPEMRKFPWNNYNVFVGGGAEMECLQDFLDVMEHLKVSYKKVRGYIFGD